MSKSKGNVVDPQALIDRYGADTVRLFMMFAAPPDQSLEWSDAGVEGAYRFLRRLWTFAVTQGDAIRTAPVEPNWALAGEGAANRAPGNPRIPAAGAVRLWPLSIQYRSVRRHEDPEQPAAYSDGGRTSGRRCQAEGVSILLRLLSPVTPHIAHVLWQALDYEGAVIDAPWPAPDAAALKRDTIALVVQVNGKVRAQIEVPRDAGKGTIEQIALAAPNVQRFVEDKKVRKIIVAPGKLVNIVCG